jgi:hypothetical protein
LIEAQLNGAFGFDFSVVPKNISQYPKELSRINKSIIKTGVTSYTPTTTCQKPDVYHKVFVLIKDYTTVFSFLRRFFHILVLPDLKELQVMEQNHLELTLKDRLSAKLTMGSTARQLYRYHEMDSQTLPSATVQTT